MEGNNNSEIIGSLFVPEDYNTPLEPQGYKYSWLENHMNISQRLSSSNLNKGTRTPRVAGNPISLRRIS